MPEGTALDTLSPMVRLRVHFSAAALALLLAGVGCDPPRLPEWTHPLSQVPEAAVYRAWQRYLRAKQGRYFSCREYSDAWLVSEQQDWPCYDIAHSFIPFDATPEVTGIDTLGDALAGEYRVTTRFRSGDQRPAARAPWSMITTTVYAVPVGNRWLFSSALSRTTGRWAHETVGRITYVIEPDLTFHRERALRANAFVDSLAAAFGVPPIGPATVYLTEDQYTAYRVIGLEWGVKEVQPGGFARPINRQIFSGNPAVGEEYRHELAHLVLMPLITGTTSYLASEGVPTWVGGTSDVDFAGAERRLATWLAEHPSVTLDSIMAGGTPNPVFYASGAMLTAMVSERGGVAAVKEFLQGGATRNDLQGTLTHLLGTSWTEVEAEWRRRVMDYGARAARPQ